jgi:hypothetical protein
MRSLKSAFVRAAPPHAHTITHTRTPCSARAPPPNSLAVPRKAKEAIGAITRLTAADGSAMTVRQRARAASSRGVSLRVACRRVVCVYVSACVCVCVCVCACAVRVCVCVCVRVLARCTPRLVSAACCCFLRTPLHVAQHLYCRHLYRIGQRGVQPA